MTNYTWIIVREYAPTENNLEKVIKDIHWRYQATEEDITKEVYGKYSLPEPNPENFLPYEKITDKVIIEWLEKGLDIENLQQNLKNQIDDVKNPKRVIDTNSYTNDGI